MMIGRGGIHARRSSSKPPDGRHNQVAPPNSKILKYLPRELATCHALTIKRPRRFAGQRIEGAARMGDRLRRLVTGHDADGNSIVESDAPPGLIVQVGGRGGPAFFEVWSTRETPAPINRASEEPVESTLVLAPPRNGTRLRVIDFPPEGELIRALDQEGVRDAFGSMAGSMSLQFRPGARHPLMHRTQTVDYGIVLEGEITLIMDREETTLGAGDIVVQRGTNHAWANRSDSTCRMAFVLIDGRLSMDIERTPADADPQREGIG